MAKLTITTHDGRGFDLTVADDAKFPIPRLDDWCQFEAEDGTKLTVHSRNIATILKVVLPDVTAGG